MLCCGCCVWQRLQLQLHADRAGHSPFEPLPLAASVPDRSAAALRYFIAQSLPPSAQDIDSRTTPFTPAAPSTAARGARREPTVLQLRFPPEAHFVASSTDIRSLLHATTDQDTPPFFSLGAPASSSPSGSHPAASAAAAAAALNTSHADHSRHHHHHQQQQDKSDMKSVSSSPPSIINSTPPLSHSDGGGHNLSFSGQNRTGNTTLWAINRSAPVSERFSVKRV